VGRAIFLIHGAAMATSGGSGSEPDAIDPNPLNRSSQYAQYVPLWAARAPHLCFDLEEGVAGGHVFFVLDEDRLDAGERREASPPRSPPL
jgi:hypothetical protein